MVYVFVIVGDLNIRLLKTCHFSHRFWLKNRITPFNMETHLILYTQEEDKEKERNLERQIIDL